MFPLFLVLESTLSGSRRRELQWLFSLLEHTPSFTSSSSEQIASSYLPLLSILFVESFTNFYGLTLTRTWRVMIWDTTSSHVNVQSEGGVLTSSTRGKKSEARKESCGVFDEFRLIYSTESLLLMFISMTCMMKDDLFILLNKWNAPPWFYTQSKKNKTRMCMTRAVGGNNQGS